MKTNKSYSKRIKVTRNGKLVVRKAGQDHFNAKERSRTKGPKGRAQSLTVTNDVRRRFLPGARRPQQATEETGA
ncbi:MAG TPA: 50S ribosomal protein L35 [Candidatus Paceibacterota bacterium]|nr:50S ribosomal protein L35 [Candidatus Paceibacterota bacterium]